MITDETLNYVAALLKLELEEEERETLKEDLNKILKYMETMNDLDTNGVQPMTHVLPLCNVFREDEVTNQEDRNNLLANASHKKNGCFVVPKTIV